MEDESDARTSGGYQKDAPGFAIRPIVRQNRCQRAMLVHVHAATEPSPRLKVRLTRALAAVLGARHDDARVRVVLRIRPGVSNTGLAQQLVTLPTDDRPDRVIVLFGDDRATDAHDDLGIFRVAADTTDAAARRAVRRLPRAFGSRRRARARFARATHQLAYATDAWFAMESIRAVLLAQETLAAAGIPGVALLPNRDHLLGAEIRDNSSLGPFAAAIDPAFVPDLFVPPPDADDATVDAFAAAVADALEAPARTATERRVRAAERVRRFYAELPFNLHRDVAATERAVRDDPIAAQYPDLHARLATGGVRHALELGCGVGWFATALAHHHGVRVTAVDFTAAALERARAVAERLGCADRIDFVHGDLFAFDPAERFDLVASLGVLHHTGDTRAAFDHAAHLVAPGGTLYVGLYHAPARRVFLDHFRGIAAREGEAAALAAYRRLDAVRAADDQHLRSWFRDQVLHPHETQHTLREVWPWLVDAGLELRSTSLNGFAPLPAPETLLEIEAGYEERSRRALTVERRYLPGFFTVLATRGSAAGAPR